MQSLQFLQWMPQYKWENEGVSDMVAGITVGVVLIAQVRFHSRFARFPCPFCSYSAHFSCPFRSPITLFSCPFCSLFALSSPPLFQGVAYGMLTGMKAYYGLYA